MCTCGRTSQVLERLQTAVDAPIYIDKLATPIGDAAVPFSGAHTTETRAGGRRESLTAPDRWAAVCGRHTAPLVVLATRNQR